MEGAGLANAGARLFSNPAGDYGSMVNERVGAGARPGLNRRGVQRRTRRAGTAVARWLLLCALDARWQHRAALERCACGRAASVMSMGSQS
jgi:cobalamin biosynthesis Mg chelatase CobN